MSKTVVHELPMRWADLDALNHVNNVVYLDYAAESRALLVEDGVIGVDERPSRIAIDFLRPILLSRDPVVVESRRVEDELRQAIRPADADSDFARVVTVLGGDGIEVDPAPGQRVQLRLRRSDLDQSGAVSAAKMFELFQESRVVTLASAVTDLVAGRFVVGRTEIDFGRPLRWRRESCAAVTWVSRVGTSSATIEAQIVDGDEVAARGSTTMVGFDMSTQRSRPLSDHEKAGLSTLIPRS